MSLENYIFKLIKHTFSFLKKQPKNNIKNSVSLKDHITRFTYLSCAITCKNIDILTSIDKIGGYFDNKLLLPSYISLSTNKKINFLFYLYKIIFSLTSKNFNFYLPENHKKKDYSLLASLLIVKTIHKTIFNNFPSIKKIIKSLYPLISNKRTNIKNLKGRALLLEILLKKSIYIPILKTIKLTQQEKLWLYNIENIKITSQEQFKYNLTKNYKQLCILFPIYENIELNPLWGYLYFKTKITHIAIKKFTLNKKTKTISHKKTTINIENITLNKNKKKTPHLSMLFDYKKTIDKYQGGNKDIQGDNEQNKNLSILKEMDIKQITRNNTETQSFFSSIILNNIFIPKIENINNVTIKKHLYKEWDFKNKKYNKNWCSVFIEENKKTQLKPLEKSKIKDIITKQKKNITLFREKFKQLLNLKRWKNRQQNGEDIDFDSLIDNYAYIKMDSSDKLYKYKKPTIKDLSISLIFDASLSTDSYTKNTQTIDIIKNLSLFICCGIDGLINDFSIAAFYSNTRHDCKYIFIKNFNEIWQKKIFNITTITPRGYTRIGPAIRHSTYILNKKNTKKKLLLLISDGKPTDYDEYEGKYGIMDVKHAIHEAKTQNIDVKSIIIDTKPRTYFPSMFGMKNYQLISHENISHAKILKLFHDTIKL